MGTAMSELRECLKKAISRYETASRASKSAQRLIDAKSVVLDLERVVVLLEKSK